MPIATLQTPKGTDYRLMISSSDFILFRGMVPVEVSPYVANLLKNRPDFLVIDGTMGQVPKGIPVLVPKPESIILPESIEVSKQNVAGIPHHPTQPKFERLLDKVG